MKFSLPRLLVFLVAVILLITTAAFAQVVEIPDPNLRGAIMEALELPANTTITQQEMLRLTSLSAWNSEITDLTGLQYATYLEGLGLCGNQIHDLHPLSELIHLTHLSLCGNHISDISPLANLTNLTGLDLNGNNISDITPLRNLTQLEWLGLADNSIEDISPLANLTNLWLLHIKHNRIADITPLQGLNLTDFSYDEVCDIEPLSPSVRERIENKSSPSICRIWGHFIDLEQLTTERPNIRYGIIFGIPFWFQWQITEANPYPGLSTRLMPLSDTALEERQRALEHNPNLLLLKGVQWYYTGLKQFPPDSEFWLRDENNQIVGIDVGTGIEYQIDFFHPGFQDLLVERIVAIANCGLFDGIVFDSFNAPIMAHFRSQSIAEITATITNILSRVRSRVRDDFLILANANRLKLTDYAKYINGAFMETVIDYPGGYTLDGLKEIESTLLWSEENYREPRINCLAGYSNGMEPPDSPTNRRWMRLFTTMGLTHSDGYVVYYNTGIYDAFAPFSEAEEYFYPFWETDLGRPVGAKAQRSQNIDGLFIREFTNGWAVYNRSGKTQSITLPASATPVSDREDTSASTVHRLPDLDGEIYLKAKNPADVNGDWVVDVLDLLQVANGLGTATPDPNGDGEVNILDLVFVAQQFSE